MQELRYSTRNVSRHHRKYNFHQAKEVLRDYYIFPKFIDRESMIKILMLVTSDVFSMPQSDRDYHLGSKSPYHSSFGVMKIDHTDIEKISIDAQHLHEVHVVGVGNKTHTFDPKAVHVKFNDDNHMQPTPISFTAINDFYTEHNDGLGVCCFTGISNFLPSFPTNQLLNSSYKFYENATPTDIITKGGFYSPLHQDVGVSNRHSVIANFGCIKIWMFARSMNMQNLLDSKIAEWKSAGGANNELSIDVKSQIEYIMINPDMFDFVVQLPGEQLEHTGGFHHAVITMINPDINPQLFCISLGFRVANINAMKRKITVVLSNDGQGIGWQTSTGELQPVVPSSKVSSASSSSSSSSSSKRKKSRSTTGLVAGFVTETLKGLHAATSSHDLKVAKDAVMSAAINHKSNTEKRLQHGLKAKQEKKEKKNKQLLNLKRY